MRIWLTRLRALLAQARGDDSAYRGRSDQYRRKKMDNLVGAQGNDVLFDQQFDSIRRRLEKAEGTDAVGPETVLNSRENFSLEDRDESEKSQKNTEDRANVKKAGSNPLYPDRSATQEREDPLLRDNENLIERMAHPRPRNAIRFF